jgi:hypothetical protein
MCESDFRLSDHHNPNHFISALGGCMALQQISWDIQGKTGSVESIEFVPTGGTTTVSIVSVGYGDGVTNPPTISSDRTSFQITVLKGPNVLNVLLFSPDKTDGSAKAQQTTGGVTDVLEEEIDFQNGSAIWHQKIFGV